MRSRYLAFAAVPLAALTAAEPAQAQCSSSTTGGVTSLTCGNTVTTNATNTNENNPSTTARAHRYGPTINANFPQGAAITGLGLLIWPTGSNPLTVTNNGTVSHTAGQTADGQPVTGLDIVGNGGLVTYLGNGSATTNATPPGLAAGLSISNTNGGGVDIGSQAAPVTGTFSGEGGLIVRTPSGSFINAFFHGGTFTGANTANDALELSGLGNVTLVMTGHSTLDGSLDVGLFGNAPDASVVSVTTDAQITKTLGPALSVSGASGGTSATIGAAAAITGQATGVTMLSEGGEMRLTTAAGSIIHATSVAAIGVQLQPSAGSGTIVADLSGSITSANAGLYLAPANGSASVTIREGGSVSGEQVGITLFRLGGSSGVVDILNLGTISSPNQAANFDGTLRIGNGGTSGTIEGDILILNGGSLIFNRSNASTYAGDISGMGTLTKLGAGILTLSGANTHSGATNVNAGTLLVNGSLTGATTVAAGAVLGGTGSVGNVAMNGELAPGGEGVIGTLTVDGSLAFGPASNFILDISNAAADRLNVAETTSLNGTITLVPNGGNFLVPVGGTYPERFYTVLESAGPLTGTFQGDVVIDGSFDPFGIITPNIRYEYQSAGFTVGRVIVALEVPAIFETFSNSVTETVTSQSANARVDTFSTRILGRLTGGTPLFDLTYAAAFTDPQVQAGVDQARLAITTAGGPGVIVDGPTRIERTETQVSSATSTARTVRGETVTVSVQEATGPGTFQLGERGLCATPGGTDIFPTGCERGTELFLPADRLLININTNTDRDILEVTTTTNTFRISETYELTGTVVSVGRIHAEVQSGLSDLGGRLLGRLSAIESGSAGWGEAYAFRVSQSGRRDAWGLTGGVGIAIAPGVTLGLGVDQGWLDIDVPGALETGEVELTELGGALRYESGPFSASIAAVHGFGNAETRRTIIGSSAADYDVKLTGAAIEIGYAIETAGWTLRPVAGLDYVDISTDGFTETDTLGLTAADQSADRVRGSAGLEIGRDFGPVAMAVSARYLAVLDGEQRVLPVSFANAPGVPLTMTGPSEPDSALLGARLRVPLAPTAALRLGYDGRFGNGYDGHAGFVGLSIGF